MKRLLAILTLLSTATLLLNAQILAPIFKTQPASGAACCTFVNTVGNHTDPGGATSIASSSAMNLTSGNSLWVYCKHGTDSTTSISISDTAGNTFISAVSNNFAQIGLATLFYSKNVTGNAADTITCTFGASVDHLSLIAVQYSNASTAAPLDATATGTASAATSVTSGTFTTTTANEVALACVSANTNTPGFVAGTGYTIEATQTDSACEDKVFTSTQTNITASMSSTPTNVYFAMDVGTIK